MKNYLSLIKFSHTVFALPFALLGYFLALEGRPVDWALLAKVVLCMVFARSSAMAFNRWADRAIDGNNPRTAVREIPAGVISPQSALLFVFLNAIAFVAVTYTINRLCFLLSPIALAVVLGYSYTKRFTALCHLVLGLGLALAPIGAWLAVQGHFDGLPILLGASVLAWVSGFDIIYALQDAEFDRNNDLYSIPSTVGPIRALGISRWLHLLCAALLGAAVWTAHGLYPALGLISWTAFGIFVCMLVYQHALVKPHDLSRVNLAFFTTNGFASLLFGGLTIIDLLV